MELGIDSKTETEQKEVQQNGRTSTEQVTEQEGKKEQTPKAKRFIIVSLALLNLVVGIDFAMLAPFYPEEAAKKGISTAWVGFTFGEFQLIIVLVSPLIGILLPKIGAKLVCVIGTFIFGIAAIIFGLSVYVPPGAPFLTMTLVVRGIMGVATAMIMTASFAIIAATFTDNVSAMFGVLETVAGVGLMLGPPIGGALYQFGGFITPFAVIGTIGTAVAPLTIYTLKFNSPIGSSDSKNFFKLLVNPHMVFPALVLWSGGVAIGFPDPVLQPFLKKNFNLNHLVVGFVFIIGPFIYAVTAPLFGYVCDRKPIVKYVLCFSPLLNGLSLLLLHPSPIFHVGHPKLWITIIGLIIFGLGSGACFAPVTKDLLSESLLMGHKDDFGTFCLVSGFINTFQSLGLFSGPILSGTLTGKFGFAWSTTIMGFVTISIGVIYTTYTITFMFFCGGRHRVRILSKESPVDNGKQHILSN